jgi:hypothetical protein
VVAQVVPLPESDRLGRGGRYLAHVLVLTAADFARCDAAPWRILERFGFVTTVAAALALGERRAGDIPAAALALPEVLPAGRPAPWPAAETARLALLALRAGHLARQRSALALVGDAPQIAAALAAALAAVPVALRPRCSFDTCFVRGNLVATYFWGVGLPEDPGRPNLVVVDAAGRRVPGPLPVSPETAYERWAVDALAAGWLEDVARDREAAYALAEWLEGRAAGPPPLDAVPLAVVEALLRLNPRPGRPKRELEGLEQYLRSQRDAPAAPREGGTTASSGGR